ncbi:TcpD family membrane protein [Priestia sp. SB1]|uniref:TcpD family membrane protein n=1 Tax=Priestia sp. SB1 TaxID=3132359 RepID=UPI003180144E
MNNLILKAIAGSSLGAGMPTLNGVSQWIQTEGGNALTIVLVLFSIMYAIRQSWGKLIGFLLLAGLVFFTIGSPDRILSVFSGIGNKIIGG